MSTEIYKNHYKELYINLLISQLEQMKNHSITIEQFNQVLKNIDKLHQIQIETIELEDELNIPFWNGEKYID
jgi:uncharacterized protein Yka (UPF0111/DUF47 family)